MAARPRIERTTPYSIIQGAAGLLILARAIEEDISKAAIAPGGRVSMKRETMMEIAGILKNSAYIIDDLVLVLENKEISKTVEYPKIKNLPPPKKRSTKY